MRWAEPGAVFNGRRRIAARSLPLAPQAAHVHARTLHAEKKKSCAQLSERLSRPPGRPRTSTVRRLRPSDSLPPLHILKRPATATPCPCSPLLSTCGPLGEPSVVRR